MLQDLINSIKSGFSIFNNIWELIKHLFTSLYGLFEWLFVSLDFSREVVNYVPWEFATIFMAMTAISVLFVIFGRLK